MKNNPNLLNPPSKLIGPIAVDDWLVMRNIISSRRYYDEEGDARHAIAREKERDVFKLLINPYLTGRAA